MTTQTTPKGAWKITFLLFLYMLVNFADKIVVGLAGVPIMTDLKLEPEQFGFLGSSFFFLFSISAIVVGFIVNRVDTRWVLLILALIWALVQFPMVGTVSFTTLVICRIIASFSAPVRGRPLRSPCTRSTNGFRTRSVRCRRPSCRKGRRSGSSWRYRRSIGSSSTTPGITRSAFSAWWA
jgi:sugar phosphate permease